MKIILISILLLCLSHPALAQHSGALNSEDASLKLMFQQIDVDRNGLISQFEAQRNSKYHFGLSDKNKDGILDSEEYIAGFEFYKEPQQTEEIQKFLDKNDLDGDGKITQYENMTANKMIFKSLDANNDGNITLEEFIAGMR